MSQEMYFSRMQKLLKDEYNAYIESLSKPLYRGMRMNLKKANLNEFDHRCLTIAKKGAFIKYE